MPQTIQLFDNQKATPQGPAQVSALDPRPRNQAKVQHKHLRNLRLSDLLSRNLEIDLIIETFMTEISSEVSHCGYRFNCEEIDASLERGKVEGHSANYRLKLQNWLLGELTLFKRSSFTSLELCELEDLLCALIYPIRNALRYQIALTSAYRDPLTGLNNRALMEKNLQREIDLAKRHSQSMTLLVMDLDGFKNINDNCGHDVGDKVLREVARVISHSLRSTDLVYRYGGDEFVAGLPHTDIPGAINVSDRIRRSIEKLDLAACGSTEKVQISIGITEVEHNDNFVCTFKRADNALYQAKLNGKNQLSIF